MRIKIFTNKKSSYAGTKIIFDKLDCYYINMKGYDENERKKVCKI